MQMDMRRFTMTVMLKAAGCLSLMVLCSSVASAKVTTTQKKIGTQKIETIQVDIDRIDLKPNKIDGKKFVKASLVGVEGHEGVQYQVGSPEIPVVRFLVAGDDIKVSAAEGKIQKSMHAQPLIPNQESAAKIEGEKAQFKWNKSSYEVDSFYPALDYKIEKSGSIRGQQQYLITLFPLKYNPAAKSYEQIKSFKIEVKSQASTKNLKNLNHIVFVVGEEFKENSNLLNYMDLKKSLGFKVSTINVTSENDADYIRSEVKSLYDSEVSLSHVLIVGDAEDVQSHRAEHISGVTDHYYRAIDTDDYEEDINGPDVGVGRISVQTNEQLDDVLDKYTRYQKASFSDEKWLNGVAFLATDDRHEVAEGSHNYAIDNYTKDLGYVGIFPEEEQLGGDQVYAITHDASTADTHRVIKAGRTIINYSGHGGTTSWAAPSVKPDVVRSIDDPNAMPFVISNACITGKFTVSESFAETWQRHINGAIMFWGSMDNTYWGEDDILEKRMYDAIFKEGFSEFSRITQFALAGHWAHFGGEGRAKYYWETYVTFGDPSVNLRSTYSKQAKFENVQNNYFVGIPEISLVLKDSEGKPAKNAKVTLVSDELGLSISSFTDEGGQVEFSELEDLTLIPGAIKVFANGGNIKPLETEIQIAAPNAPFVFANNFTVNNQSLSELKPGQLAKVKFDVKNIGIFNSPRTLVSLKVLSGPASTTGINQTLLPALIPNDVINVAQHLELVVDSDATNGETIEAEVQWQANADQFMSKKFTFKVLTAQLVTQKVLVLGSEGIVAGETKEIQVDFKNIGQGGISNYNFSIAPLACIDGDSLEDFVVEQLSAGQELTKTLEVTLNDECNSGDLASARFVGVSAESPEIASVDFVVEFRVGRISTMSFEDEDVDLEIEDDSETIHAFDFEHTGEILNLSVYLKISHTYPGDLKVLLVHPDGTEALVLKGSGSNDDIEDTFDLESSPEFSKFEGKSSQGAWQLKIVDQAARDTGTLEAFKVDISGVFE